LCGEPPADAKERFLRPGLLTPMRQLNPDVSPRVERAIFRALSMHPNERPSTAREFRDLLLGSDLRAYPPTPSTLLSTVNSPLRGWSTILKENGLLVGLAGVLLVIALLISIV
jgi:eukaryotic-like serine/threonine-protein kinase